MKAKKMRYYRTAALLGPKEQHVAFRAKPRPIKIPWQVIVVVVAVIGLGAWVAFGNAWYLGWDDITVTGLSTLEARYEVKKTSDLWDWHRFSLDTETAESVLVAAFPEYKDIKINCDIFPTKCEIAVTPRRPVMTWVAGADSYWVDDDWVFYPVLADRPDLPVIRGPLPAATSTYSVTDIYAGVQALAILDISADALDFVAQRGLVWTDPAGRRVAFGVGPNMAPRLQMYEFVVGHCEAEGIFPQAVDVRFPEGATYAMERTW